MGGGRSVTDLGSRWRPAVTVAVPVLNEETHLSRCLTAIESQSYEHVVEILVVDGGSTDGTLAVAAEFPSVRVVANPRRIQAAALNIALGLATGEVFVRVDGHCVIAHDYVERCVKALHASGAAIVGGAMTPSAVGTIEEGIAAAMASPFGAGPATFHRPGAAAAWVDTVYLGAYRTEQARSAGGYAEDVGVNEDSEFAIRMHSYGGVWFDPSIQSVYSPRATLSSVARQFYRYGRSRAATVRRHPRSLAVRQVVAPGLVLGLVSPWRRHVLLAYVGILAAWTAAGARRRPLVATAVLPTMHVPWGVGFLVGLVRSPPHRPLAAGRELTSDSSALPYGRSCGRSRGPA